MSLSAAPLPSIDDELEGCRTERPVVDAINIDKFIHRADGSQMSDGSPRQRSAKHYRHSKNRGHKEFLENDVRPIDPDPQSAFALHSSPAPTKTVSERRKGVDDGQFASNRRLVAIVVFAFVVSLYNLVCNWNVGVPGPTSRKMLIASRRSSRENLGRSTKVLNAGEKRHIETYATLQRRQMDKNADAISNSTSIDRVRKDDLEIHSTDNNENLAPKLISAKEMIKPDNIPSDIFVTYDRRTYLRLIHKPRIVALKRAEKWDSSNVPAKRRLEQYNAEYSDHTQLYPQIDSGDKLSSLVSQEMKRKVFPDNEIEPGDCVPQTDWQTGFYPTCNAFHDQDIIDGVMAKNTELFGTKGFWRHAWSMADSGGQNGDVSGSASSVVLKTLRYEHNYEEDFYETNRVDAVAMERLSAEPNVIDIHGFCGMSALTEFASGQFKAHVDEVDSLEKLKLARDVALGLAAVHSIDPGRNVSLVHNDINPSNVVVHNGVVKLNDFNIGVLVTWNEKDSRQCHFLNHFPNSQWRAPEEQMLDGVLSNVPLSEKIDIYGIGNIFYRMIVGHDPWREYKGKEDGRIAPDDQNKIATLKRTKGTPPPLPRRIRKSKDVSIAAIRDVMNQCFRFKPEERPSAQSVAEQLSLAYEKQTDRQKT